MFGTEPHGRLILQSVEVQIVNEVNVELVIPRSVWVYFHVTVA